MSSRRRRRTGAPGLNVRTFQGLLILGLVAGAFGVLLLYNAGPVQSFALPAGALITATPTEPNWQALIATQFLLNATPLPTTDPLIETYAPPTPWWVAQTTPRAFAPDQIATAQPAETLPPPTETPEGDTRQLLARAPVATATPRSNWNPPAIVGQISLDPRDHFWFVRPIDSDRINYGLEWYHYGSRGPESNMRVHMGEDFSNPRGVPIVAAGDGVVIWADEGIQTTRRNGRPEHITTYGNVLVIEHDFSYRGKPIYTLYAHMSAFAKQPGDRVKAGEVIGLVGATGQVGGPHLHFEVRIGWNSYYETRNPTLWIAPYVGAGVVAGRVVDANGAFVEEARVELVDMSTRKTVLRHTTYGPGANPDDEWNENFAFPDVYAGDYEVVAWIGGERVRERVTVLPGVTSFVELWGSSGAPAATPQSVSP